MFGLKYEITFKVGEGVKFDAIKVQAGSKLSSDLIPKRAKHTFAGWYTDATLTKPWDINRAITSNLTLYAKWKENKTESPTVNDVSDLDSEFSGKSEPGATIILIADSEEIARVTADKNGNFTLDIPTQSAGTKL